MCGRGGEGRVTQDRRGETETERGGLPSSVSVCDAGGEGEVGGSRGRPNQQRWRAKMEAQSEYVHVAYTFLHVLAPICYARSVLVNKISASELSRKSIKSALLVGERGGRERRYENVGDKTGKDPTKDCLAERVDKLALLVVRCKNVVKFWQLFFFFFFCF